MSFRHFVPVVIAGITALASLSAAAATTAAAGQTPAEQPAAAGANTVLGRYAGDLGVWAGSEANAVSLLEGLSNKTPIILNGQGAQPAAGKMSFTSPVGSMSHRNAYIALALARQQLAALGLTRPLPEQIAAALVGGSVSLKRGKHVQSEQLVGVLNLRASGMEWPKAAQVIGVKFDADLGNLDANAVAATGAPASHDPARSTSRLN